MESMVSEEDLLREQRAIPIEADHGQRDSSETIEVLIVEIGGHQFGIPALDVQEIVHAVACVPLPDAPAMVEGVINLRGTVVPVLDLRARIGVEPKAAESSDHLVVATVGDRRVSLRVDRAVDLARIEANSVEHARDVVPGWASGADIATFQDSLLVFHDLGMLLSPTASDAIEGALRQGETPREPR